MTFVVILEAKEFLTAVGTKQRKDMEWDLQSLFGLHVHVHSCIHLLRPRNPWLNMELDLQSVFGLLCTAAPQSNE